MPESNRAPAGHSIGVNNIHADKRLTFRPSVAADFDAFYGHRLGPSVRAVTLLLDESPVGIIGLAEGIDCRTLFSDARPEIEPYMKTMTVLRAIRHIMRMVEVSQKDVLAIRQEGTDLLDRLGFEHVRDDIYRYPQRF